MDPLNILPPELWGMIFENLEDPQDWLNLYRASPTFEGVVGGDERLNALLSQVFPHVYKHLLDEGQSGLLRLRLVSRKWKRTVDRILNSADDEGNALKYERYLFDDSAKILSFLNQFEAHPGNPLIGSFVTFAFEPKNKTEEMMTEFEGLVARLMGKFGMHVKTMIFVSADVNLENVLRRQLRSCVELTPNLEELGVVLIEPDADDDDDDNVEYREANPDLGNQPMPPILSKLKSFLFNTERSSKELADLQDIIIRTCCSPDTLTTANVIGVPPSLATFPKLERMTLSITHREEDESNLKNYSIPLRRLILRGDANNVGILGLVMEYAAHFKETLVYLRINCRWAPINGNSPYRLHLPHLRYLTIPCLVSRGSPFNLVENLFNLEELCFTQQAWIPGLFPRSPAYFRQFELFVHFIEEEMSKFPVWERFPKLKILKLTGFEDEESEPRFKIYRREN